MTIDNEWKEFNEEMDILEDTLPMWLFDREYRRMIEACEALDLDESLETLKCLKNNITKGLKSDNT